MLLSPKPNVLFNHTTKIHAMLTLCSYTSGFRGASGATGRYEHDIVTTYISDRQYTAKPRGYGAYTRFSRTTTNTAAGSKRSEILEWISNVPYTSHHKLVMEGRLAGTGKWIFEREEYHTWRSSSASKLLLLRGIRMSSCASIGMSSRLTSLPI